MCLIKQLRLFRGADIEAIGGDYTEGSRGPGGRKKGVSAELCVTGPAFQRAWPAGFVVAMFKGRKVDTIRLQTAHPHLLRL